MSTPASLDLVALKANADPNSGFAIPIIGPDDRHIGRLVCVDRARAGDSALHVDLTAWRKRYMKYFLTQFEASPPRTAAWLRNVVLPGDDRILFLIEAEDGVVIGHVGVSNIDASSAELDNLIRGRSGGDARLIFHAEIALLNWIYFGLEREIAMLHVFSTNRTTTALHESVGFRLHARKRLSEIARGTEIRYLVDSPEGAPLDFEYHEMRLTKEVFVQRYGEHAGRSSHFLPS